MLTHVDDVRRIVVVFQLRRHAQEGLECKEKRFSENVRHLLNVSHKSPRDDNYDDGKASPKIQHEKFFSMKPSAESRRSAMKMLFI